MAPHITYASPTTGRYVCAICGKITEISRVPSYVNELRHYGLEVGVCSECFDKHHKALAETVIGCISEYIANAHKEPEPQKCPRCGGHAPWSGAVKPSNPVYYVFICTDCDKRFLISERDLLNGPWEE